MPMGCKRDSLLLRSGALTADQCRITRTVISTGAKAEWRNLLRKQGRSFGFAQDDLQKESDEEADAFFSEASVSLVSFSHSFTLVIAWSLVLATWGSSSTIWSRVRGSVRG